jgi:hypothetical protein
VQTQPGPRRGTAHATTSISSVGGRNAFGRSHTEVVSTRGPVLGRPSTRPRLAPARGAGSGNAVYTRRTRAGAVAVPRGSCERRHETVLWPCPNARTRRDGADIPAPPPTTEFDASARRVHHLTTSLRGAEMTTGNGVYTHAARSKCRCVTVRAGQHPLGGVRTRAMCPGHEIPLWTCARDRSPDPAPQPASHPAVTDLRAPRLETPFTPERPAPTPSQSPARPTSPGRPTVIPPQARCSSHRGTGARFLT